MITTLLWDLDNTLLDFPSAERQALITTFADFTLGPCSPDLLVRYSALNARWWRRVEEGKVTKDELLPGRFREFVAASTPPISTIWATPSSFWTMAMSWSKTCTAR